MKGRYKMNTVTENYFKSSDGVHRCHYITVTPDREPRGVVQISHGMCEYIERYLDFMNFLADNGFAVCGNDHLGHGKTVNSPDELGYFSPENGWQNAVEDLHRLTAIMKREYPDKPYFMIGHSMGSFLARAYAVKHAHECRAYIFMGTADGFETSVSSAAEKAGKILQKPLEKINERRPNPEGRLGSAAITLLLSQGEILKKVKGEKYRSEALNKIGFGRNNERIEPSRTPYDWISRDESVVDKYAADPLCTFIFTVNGFLNLASVLWFVSNEKWYGKAPKDIPMLLLGGDGDPVGNYGRGVRSVYERLLGGGCDVSLKIYPDARHELLNELNREEVYGDALKFIESSLG